jgi:hypothetical protein
MEHPCIAREAHHSVIGAPSTNSMTKQGRPRGVSPPSSTRAMHGCSIRASVCRSASKRCSTAAESMPGFTILIATRCSYGARRSACQTVP